MLKKVKYVIDEQPFEQTINTLEGYSCQINSYKIDLENLLKRTN